MKNIALLALASSIILACGGKAPAPAVSSSAAVEPVASSTGRSFTVNNTESTIRWEGYEGLALLKPEHYGSISLQSGSLTLNGDTLSAGGFIADMNTITVLDIPVEKPGHMKLTNHLKNQDFFDVPSFPTASFDITGSRRLNADSVLVTGNFTIKGIARSVTFPARLKISDAEFEASATVVINRKDWGIVYRADESLGDKMIRPEIKLDILLKGTAQAS
jgi:polyisoprenoid-binding protein YceI